MDEGEQHNWSQEDCTCCQYHIFGFLAWMRPGSKYEPIVSFVNAFLETAVLIYYQDHLSIFPRCWRGRGLLADNTVHLW
jgi:hypothetical protein